MCGYEKGWLKMSREIKLTFKYCVCMECVFRTRRSGLRVGPLPRDERELINLIIKDICDGVTPLAVRPPIMVWGKECRQNRDVGFFSDTSRGYSFSGQIAEANPLSPSLKALLDFVNDVFSASFNGILINRYEGGETSIGRHSDDESGLSRHAGVVAISVGATRTFRVKSKGRVRVTYIHDDDEESKTIEPNKIVYDHRTGDGEILQMEGDFQ